MLIAICVLMCSVFQVAGLWLIAKAMVHTNETPYDTPISATMDTLSTDYGGLV